MATQLSVPESTPETLRATHSQHISASLRKRSKWSVCLQFGIHWDTVVKVREHTKPPDYPYAYPWARRKFGSFLEVIDEIPKGDKMVHYRQPDCLWYRARRYASFEDMVMTLRRESLREQVLPTPPPRRGSQKLLRILLGTLQQAA